MARLIFQNGSQLFLLEPSGLCYEYKAWAIGKHRQAAKTEIEKLKFEDIPIQQLVNGMLATTNFWSIYFAKICKKWWY